MNRCQTLVTAFTFLALAACGEGGTATPLPSDDPVWNDGECTCRVDPQGQLLSLPANEVTALRARVASFNLATVGLSFAGSGNTIRMDIRRPLPGTVVGPTETVVSFDTMPSIIRDKAVHPKNICSRVELVLLKRAITPGSLSISLSKQSCNSGWANVEFHDAGVQLGEFDPATFWGLAGGHLVTFVWLSE